MTLEVDAAKRDGGGEAIERPAQAGVVRGEDGGDREHRGGMPGRKGIDVGREGRAEQAGGGHRGVRSRAAHQVLEREFHGASGDEGECRQPGRVLQPQASKATGQDGEGRARDEQRDAAADRIEDADDEVQDLNPAAQGPGGHDVVGHERGAEQEEKDAERRSLPVPRQCHVV